jgi:ribosome recycling factor
MAYNFQPFKSASEATLAWMQKEYAALRTGRSTPQILDGIQVDSYGSKMPINQLANISIEDARTLRIAPWDKTVSKSIDTAIRESNLGLSVALDDQGLRVSFPELTADRRTSLAKVAKQKLEEARIRVRTEREKVHSDLEKQEKLGLLSKDDTFRGKTELQKLVDEVNKKLEELFIKKEKEILE